MLLDILRPKSRHRRGATRGLALPALQPGGRTRVFPASKPESGFGEVPCWSAPVNPMLALCRGEGPSPKILACGCDYPAVRFAPSVVSPGGVTKRRQLAPADISSGVPSSRSATKVEWQQLVGTPYYAHSLLSKPLDQEKAQETK